MILGIGVCIMNFPPFKINFFSFLKISFLKFQAPKKTKSIFFGIPPWYLTIGIFVPGKSLFCLSLVVSKK